MFLRLRSILIILCATAILAGCSTTRHIPDGSLLLDDVKINVDDSTLTETSELVNYLRQTPNHKVLGFAKLQLATYNMSGRDTSKWYNRWLRRMGQAPVIYNPELTEASRRQLQLALINKGYMSTVVDVDTISRPDKKKMSSTTSIPAHLTVYRR